MIGSKQLVGYTITVIKPKTFAYGINMTKAEAYDKAWRLGARGDFSLVDQIYHPDYSSFDYRTGIEANIEDDKLIVTTI